MKRCCYLFLFLSIYGTYSCNKLDRELITTLTAEQIEKSFSFVQNLSTAVYTELPEGFLYIDGAMLASATDDAEHTSEISSIHNFNNGNWNAVNNPDAGAWTRSYRAIRKANQFLVSADSINMDGLKLDPSPSSQQAYQIRLDQVKRWKYEVRFLRAFFYFELVKRYGGVPIIKSALSIDEIDNVTRASLQDCLRFITDECDSAAAVLPLTYAAADLGRATKVAALSLKSRALLYAASDLFNTPAWAGGFSNTALISLTGNRADRWKAAADAAKAVIDLAGTPALGQYRALFNTFNNAEIIFTRRNIATNDFEKATFPIGYDGGQSGTTPSQDLVDAYEIKTSATTAIKFDWNNPLHAATPFATTGPLARDPRLFMTVITNSSPFKDRNVEIWRGGRDGEGVTNATKTGYYLKKYLVESVNLQTGGTAIHSWIFFRLPEIYLNYAEALNEYSPGHPDIKIYYDRVRNRTGVAMPLLPAGLNQQDVRSKIRNERRIEFAFEDHRAWDVRRWMIAPQTLGTPIRGVDITRLSSGAFTYTPSQVENRVFETKMYLYPIPQSELNISRGLVQNPLW